MNRILSKLPGGLGVCFLLQVCITTTVAQSTAFTYQGRLEAGGVSANGNYDIRFALFDAASAGNQQGGALTNLATGVSNGLFTVVLDFGNQYPGAGRWLEIAVRTNGGAAFTVLNPRQPITSIPYAVKAAGVDASAITGTISPASIGSGAFAGTFTGNGNGLTNLPAGQLSGSVSESSLANAWKIAGNSGTASNINFLGTLDNQPLEIKVNAQRALRIERDTNSQIFGYAIPNIVGGFESNRTLYGAAGVTIAGGGGPEWYGATTPNQVGGSFSTIGGGIGHTIYAVVSAIAGGERNYIGTNAYNSFIGGGAANWLHASDSVIGGGRGCAIYDNSYNSVIGGGGNNYIQTNSPYAVISGGSANSISLNSSGASIAGGYNNVISGNAAESCIAGGYGNAILTGASYSLVGGFQARAAYPGTFVWADTSGGNFTSTAVNQFLVRAAGGVGIGTASPGAQLEVRTTNTTGLVFRFGYYTGGAGNLIAGPSRIGVATDDMVERFSIRQGSGNVGIGTIAPTYLFQVAADSAAKPNGGSWANSSDARLKRNITTMTNALERLSQLRGVNFEWINPEDHAGQTGAQGGFIAQEIEKVFPKWTTEVDGAEHDRALTPNGKVKSLSLPFEFDGLVVEAIKEQQALIHARDEEIRLLNERLTALEQRFLQLKLPRE